MKRWFADANLFLRFFTDDDSGQRAASRRLFERAAAGAVRLVVGPPVLFEVAWTLRSAYRQPQEKVVEALRAITGMPGVQVLDRTIVDDALTRSERTGVEFADAYILASCLSHRCDGVATFNRSDFAKLGAPMADF